MESSFLSKPSSITNILTLRYDPSIVPNLSRKTWNDFKPRTEKPSIEFVEKSIVNAIRKQLDVINKPIMVGTKLRILSFV